MKRTQLSGVSSSGRVARKPMEIRLTGYEVVEKRAERGGTSGRIYVPKSWIGKRVRAIRIDR
jgi:putative transposon-encoded protein